MAEKMSINQVLSLTKIVRERLNELRSLRQSLATKERHFFGEEEKKRTEIEPQFDVRTVDKKVIELENFLFLADSAVKTSNAITKLDLEINVTELLEPLK